MLFNSYEFLFAYLPIVFAGFFFLARFGQQVSGLWLVLASVFFYGWWSPKYIGLLLLSIVFNFGMGVLIGRARAQGGQQSRLFLIFALVINLSVLGFYKYINFLLGAVNDLAGSAWPVMDILLPLGISFFTFTQIAFLVDVYRGEVKEYSFVHYALFVTYFPHLIAGPVLHHGQMMPQFARRATYRIQPDQIAMGLSIFAVGLVKKIMLADPLALYANAVFTAAGQGVAPNMAEAWTGALAYTLQLYFDFSGYSDMAIGLSKLFGINLPVNFNSPYKASNIIDFWRRWHMTLSQFLRDYLYIPLGGGRSGRISRYINLMVTMLLGGLWHGANWTFVVWGGLHGLFLMINHGWRALFPQSASTWRVWHVALTFICVVLAWVIFRAENWQEAWQVIKGCFGVNGIGWSEKTAARINEFGHWLGYDWGVAGQRVYGNIAALDKLGSGLFVRKLLFALLIIWAMPNTQQLFSYAGASESRIFKWPVSWQLNRRWALLIAVAFLVCFANLNKVSTFLYYQF